MTEWNSMAVYSAPVHDEKYSAAFLVKSVMDLKGIMDAYMFWCCSDVFEELFILGKPFHGSYGIVSNDGIPKPNFWGFKMLSQLFPQRLDLPVTNKDVETDIEISVNTTVHNVTKQVIDDTHCNPKAEWLKLGKPDLFTPEQVRKIKEKTRLTSEPQPYVTENGMTNICLSMQTNDVVLLTLE